MLKLRIFLTTFALLLVASACPSSGTNKNTAGNGNENKPAADIGKPLPTATDDVAEGKKLFATNCVRCHKEEGTGGRSVIEGKTLNAEDLTSAKMIKEPDSEYYEYIENGVKDEGMPAFKDILNETEIRQVVRYIRAELQKP